MIKLLLELNLISMILVFANSVSGFGDAVKNAIWRRFVFPKPIDRIPTRPFFCDTCLTFWVGLAFLIFTWRLNVYTLALLCLVSHFTTITATFLYFIRDLSAKIFEGLYRIFKL